MQFLCAHFLALFFTARHCTVSTNKRICWASLIKRSMTKVMKAFSLAGPWFPLDQLGSIIVFCGNFFQVGVHTYLATWPCGHVTCLSVFVVVLRSGKQSQAWINFVYLACGWTNHEITCCGMILGKGDNTWLCTGRSPGVFLKFIAPLMRGFIRSCKLAVYLHVVKLCLPLYRWIYSALVSETPVLSHSKPAHFESCIIKLSISALCYEQN